MVCTKVTRKLWKLRMNWFITLLLSPVLYSVSFVGVLTSFHRFVTDPKLNATQQQNSTVEGGLGESELFYSLIIGAQHLGSVIGSLVCGFLVRYMPFLILFLTAICFHIVGYVLYGLATQGWILMVAELLAGYYLGAQGTLSYAYVTDSVSTYVKLLREKEGRFDTDEKREIRLRNLLFALKTLGNSLGSFVGAGTAILLTYLPVDQYRTIAWVNVGCGTFLLLWFLLLFREEMSCKKLHNCKQICKCSRSRQSAGPLQIFILVTMFILVFIDVVKWGFFETLMNPILSDSFGFTLSESSYFYLGFSVARIGGAVLVTFLQRIKVKPQVIGIIAILTVISGYLLIADWQAIPYDPCTECSPYHHPSLLKNISACIDATQSESVDDLMDFNDLIITDAMNFKEPVRELRMAKNLPEFNIFPYSCVRNSSCSACADKDRSCFTLLMDTDGDFRSLSSVSTEQASLPSDLFSCTHNSHSICVRMHFVHTYAETTTRSVSFQEDQDYSLASNACMNADIPHRQCHWIPFSLIGHKECEDCPPICRSIRQTLSFPQFILGMTFLVATNPLIFFPMMAVISNQSPPESQGVVIGFFFAMSTGAQSICPIFLDALYEGFEKRTFVAALIFAVLHIPFLLEFVILFKKLGPRYLSKEHKYTKLIINAETEEEDDD